MINSQDLTQDSIGFPMIRVHALNAYIHWLPLTKMHLEYFVCDSAITRYGDGWYESLLSISRRVSPERITSQNYWEALASGLLPHEVEAFADWLGREYMLPTLEQWNIAYRELKAREPLDGGVEGQVLSRKQRVHSLLDQIEDASAAAMRERRMRRTCADQMLMRNGVVELVRCPGRSSPWGGMGAPNPRFYGVMINIDGGIPHTPRDPDRQRLPYYGIRLLRRA